MALEKKKSKVAGTSLGGGGTVLAASGPQRALKEAGKSSTTMVHAPAGVALAGRGFYGREL
jgi:hypothetical protein